MDIYEQSYETLKEIVKAQEDSGFEIVLIGDWAVYLYNSYMKSRDIDFAIRKEDVWKLDNYLQMVGFSKTEDSHLGKKGYVKLFEGNKVELDVYDETVGRFPVDEVLKRTQRGEVDGLKVKVADITALVTLKLVCAAERLGTGKGSKDMSDLIALLDAGLKDIDWEYVKTNVGWKQTVGMLKTAFASYEVVNASYAISMDQYKSLKAALRRKDLV